MKSDHRAPARALTTVVALLVAACHPAPPAVAPTPIAPPAPIRSPAEPPAAAAAAAAAGRDSGRSDAAVTPPEVTDAALRLFGDSLATVGAAAPADSATAAGGDAAAAPVAATDSAAVPAPVWDIDVRSYETRHRVTYFVARFQGEAHSRFSSWLERGGRYEPMIRGKLRAAGLPEDLTYLALIESGYDPDAYSSAAAVGVWQLMTSTAQGTGLRVDWWVDERRDPVRATDGAIRFLGWLRRQFGSLFLAAAAYNGGAGRVARGLTRYADELEGQSGDDAFFSLAGTDYLRAETRDYVPKLIAAALIAKDPARYGFDVELEPPLRLRQRAGWTSPSTGRAGPRFRGDRGGGRDTESAAAARDDAAQGLGVGADPGGCGAIVRFALAGGARCRTDWLQAHRDHK